MLDWGKNLGTYCGLEFYGDSEYDDRVYYFPDSIQIAQSLDDKDYELGLQLYRKVGVDNLCSETSGGLFRLGVGLKVDPKRLDGAVKELRAAHSITNEIIAIQPSWTEGTAQMISATAEGFRTSIVQPKLNADDINSNFDVCCDKISSEMLFSVFESGQGTLATIVYDLKFAALAPLINLNLKADLESCLKTATRCLKADFRLPLNEIKINLSADLEWLTNEMVKDGSIVISCLSSAESLEESYVVDDLVKEFKSEVLDEIFSMTSIPAGLRARQSDISKVGGDLLKFYPGACYTLKDSITNMKLTLDADYSKKRCIIRHWRPQSEIIAPVDNLKRYVSSIIISDSWKNRSVKVVVPDEVWVDGLVSIEFFARRKNQDENFAVLSFNPEIEREKVLNWVVDDDDDISLIYRLHLTYNDNDSDVVSPAEIITPEYETTDCLIRLYPDSYIFRKRIAIDVEDVKLENFNSVEAIFSLTNTAGNVEMGPRIEFCQDISYKELLFRASMEDAPMISVHFKYKPKSADAIESEEEQVTGYRVFAHDPFLYKELTIVQSGNVNGIENITVTFKVRSKNTTRAQTVFLDPSESIHTVLIGMLAEDDVIEYETDIIRSELTQVIKSGIIDWNDTAILNIELESTPQREYTLTWNGPSPEDCDLKYLLVKFLDKETELASIKYFGSEIPDRKKLIVKCDNIPSVTIERKFISGEKEKESLGGISEREILISPITSLGTIA